MPKFELDLSKAPTLEAIDDGVYVVRIEGSKTKTSNNGNPVIQWSSEIVAPSEVAGQKFYFNSVVTDNALYRLKDMYKAADRLEEGVGFETEVMHGVEIGIVVSCREYESSVRNNVESYLSVAKTNPRITKPGNAQAMRDKIESGGNTTGPF